MAAKKSKSKKVNTETTRNPIQVLKDDTCPTSSGKSTIGYQVGCNEAGEVFFRLTSNTGGGMFTKSWISYTDVQTALASWPDDQAITSMALRSISRGKSANDAGFHTAILVAQGLLEKNSGKSRVHRACDPAPFLASVEELKKGAGIKPAAKPKAKPKAKAKAKTANKRSAKTAKTPRKKS